MPTSGKLVAAVLFGALAYYVSMISWPLFEEGTDPPYWMILNAAFGVLMGWIVAGSRAGTGVTAAIGYGVTTVAATAFWSLFAHSFLQMLEKSLARHYDGAMEAVVNTFELGMKMAKTVGSGEVIGVALIGGIIAGLITDWVGQRWS